MPRIDSHDRSLLEREFANYRFAISKECNRYVQEKKLRELLHTMRVESARCLYDMNTPTSFRHIRRFRRYFLNPFDRPRINCFYSEHTRTENDAVANATDSRNEISLNGFYITTNNPYITNAENIAGTVFHEAFHNFGYDHIGNVDYAYACEAACFGKNLSEEALTLSRTICAGTYNYESAAYKKAFLQFSRLTGYGYVHRFEVASHLVLQSWDDLLPHFLLGMSMVDTPLGGELMTYSFNRYLATARPHLTPAELRLIEQFGTGRRNAALEERTLFPATSALVGAYVLAVLGFYSESLTSLEKIKLPTLPSSVDRHTELGVKHFKKLRGFIRGFCKTGPRRHGVYEAYMVLRQIWVSLEASFTHIFAPPPVQKKPRQWWRV